MILYGEQEKYPSENFLSEPTVGVVTACLNESGNIRVWLSDIFSVYQKFNLTMIKEIVIVDDGSTDGTIKQIEDIIEIYPIPIRLIRRNSRMGTLNAQIIVSRQGSTDYVLVMDCDLQHPPSLIPEFIKEIKEDSDIVVGSRYTRRGFNEWPAFRGVVSRVATFLAHVLIKNSRRLTDPLSGYFLIRKEILSSLNPYRMMYKPLLYAISMNEGARMKEIPVRMDSRESGESKIVNGPIRVIVRYIREILIFYRDSQHNLNAYHATEAVKSDIKKNLCYERRK